MCVFATPPRSESPPSGDSLFSPTAVTGLSKLLGNQAVAEVACGAYSTFAVSKAGRVAAWGLNNSGQLGLAKADDADNIKCVGCRCLPLERSRPRLAWLARHLATLHLAWRAGRAFQAPYAGRSGLAGVAPP